MTTSGNARAAERWNRALMANFATPQLELVHGHGAIVTDADGNEYLDLLGGIAVNALGYTHPAIVEAVTAQVSTLAHVSNYFSDPPVLALAERLQELSGAGDEGRVAFVNSGTEANEVAFKMARLTGRPRIIATEGGFHGRTMGSLAMTGQPGKKEPFEPMPPGVEFVPFGDAEALQSAVDADPHTVAAFIVEPIQGEAGVRVPPDGYLAAARRITREAGALLILDEVQTGIGRTGTWFAHQQSGITPDVMTLAKGLGGGLPLGAVIGYGAAARLLTPGSHGTTFGGNPVCAAAALAVLDVIESSELLAHVDGLGKHVVDAIAGLSHPLVAEVRGRGLLIGMQLHEPVAAAATAAALRAGFLVNAAAGDVLRLAPPLIVSRDQADSFIAALPTILDAATATDKEH